MQHTPWFKVYSNLAHHPKIEDLADELGITRPQAVGHVTLLWCWVTEYQPDGVIPSGRVSSIERAAEWNGERGDLYAALVAVGLLDECHDETESRGTPGVRQGYDRGGRVAPRVVVHNWMTYAGGYKRALAKRAERRKAAKKRRKADGRAKPNAGVPLGCDRGALEERRGEREKKDQQQPDQTWSDGVVAAAADSFQNNKTGMHTDPCRQNPVSAAASAEKPPSNASAPRVDVADAPSAAASGDVVDSFGEHDPLPRRALARALRAPRGDGVQVVNAVGAGVNYIGKLSVFYQRDDTQWVRGWELERAIADLAEVRARGDRVHDATALLADRIVRGRAEPDRLHWRPAPAYVDPAAARESRWALDARELVEAGPPKPPSHVPFDGQPLDRDDPADCGAEARAAMLELVPGLVRH